MNEHIVIHLPQGVDLKITRRFSNRQTGKELIDLCWQIFPDVKQADRAYWSLRTIDSERRSKEEELSIWLIPEKKFSEYNFKTSTFVFCPRIYPEGCHHLSNALAVELLFLSIKRSVYYDEAKFTNQAKDILAGYALQSYIGDFVSENDSRSALRRYYLVKIGRDLDHWAECEKRAVFHHRKMVNMTRGKAIVNYLRIAQEQPTYGVQYYRGISNKTDEPWVIGVCYRGLHRYQPGRLDKPDKIFDWKTLENLYYRDRKFSVEVSAEKCQGGVKQYSWYGPTKVMKALWQSSLHAHRFYLDRRQIQKSSSALRNQKQLHDIENKLDRGSKLSDELHSNTACLSSFPDVNLVPDEKLEESPENRARELEAMMTLKEKRKLLEDEYFQRIEQLKMVLKKEAELTSIIPNELRKYQNSDDETWESEMRTKKNLKTIQQTTFINPSIRQTSDMIDQTDKELIVIKIGKRSTDHTLDELRRVQKDLEINLKITECLSKLNRNNHERNQNEKRKDIKKHQEMLYHKYVKKIQSLEETKLSLERFVRSSDYISKPKPHDEKHRPAVLLDDLSGFKTSGSNSSSSLNMDHLEGSPRQRNSRSGGATPTSNRSTSSLLEDNELAAIASGLTRQYSLRSRDQDGKPVLSTRSSSPQEGNAEDLGPPVAERTSSLTPNLSRRVSQPLVDISPDNITLRSSRNKEPASTNGNARLPVKTDNPYIKIQITSNKDIESRYCKKHKNLRKQSSFDNSNSNSNILPDGEDPYGYFHKGYGIMPKYPTPLDTLSESSFASDNPNFQNKFQIRQLLKEHFRDHLKENSKKVSTPSGGIPRSRSNTSSSAQLSTDSAFGTDGDFENAKPAVLTPGASKRTVSTNLNVNRSAPSTPGASKRAVPTSLTVNPVQSNTDPGTPTSMQSIYSSNSVGFPSMSDLAADRNEATKRKEVRPDVFSSNTTGLRRALRSRVSNDVIHGAYLEEQRLNDSFKYATLPRNYRRSLAKQESAPSPKTSFEDFFCPDSSFESEYNSDVSFNSTENRNKRAMENLGVLNSIALQKRSGETISRMGSMPHVTGRKRGAFAKYNQYGSTESVLDSNQRYVSNLSLGGSVKSAGIYRPSLAAARSPHFKRSPRRMIVDFALADVESE